MIRGEPKLSAGEVLPGVEYRSYQQDCVNELVRVRDSGERKALVHMATGLGKTVMLALDLDRYFEQYPDARVLFLSHRDEINVQAKKFLEKTLGRHAVEGHTFRSDNDPDIALSNSIVFATLQSMHTPIDGLAHAREIFEPDDFDYVVVDEAHHAEAPTFRRTIKYFEPQFLLGMTATPNRLDGKNIRSIFGHERYTKSLAHGIQEGILAQPHYIATIPEDTVGMVYEEAVKAKNLKPNFALSAESVVEDFLRRSREYVEDPKTLGYCRTIEEAEHYASLIPGARAIHSKLPLLERRMLLDAFRRGELRTVTSVDIMGEGIDVPDIDTIFFARSTSSEATFLQHLGRGLRRAQGKDTVYVFDYVAGYERLKMLGRLLGSLEESMVHDVRRGDLAKRDTDGSIDRLKPEVIMPKASFQFDGHIIDIVELLNQHTEQQERAREEVWSPEHAVKFYAWINSELGYASSRASLKEVDEYVGVDVRRQMLRPFGDSLIRLRRASEGRFFENSPEMVSVAQFCDDYITDQQAFLDAAEQEGIEITSLSWRDGRSARAVKLADAVRLLAFQGHDKPLRRRGAALDSPPKATRRVIVSQYIDLMRSLGRLPTKLDINQVNDSVMPDMARVDEVFGSLAKLRRAAGVQQVAIEEMMTLDDMANFSGHSTGLIQQVAKNHEIESLAAVGPHGLRKGYTPSDGEFILNQLATQVQATQQEKVNEEEGVEVCPDDAYTLDDCAREFDINVNLLCRRLTHLGEAPREYWTDATKSLRALYITNRQFDVYCQHYDE
ncbi:DEAD/DEAH box helicase [Candidatus Mycosynbacter amalyticus]|uniref:DEAD/DEAH box helicase n=1 Tax=Candidatus Mycosynbacter amalyticus TaxID=2665156 RepID=A0A857MQZ2_9BACT|nr:DEAD/DEAH box helicase family protein [Candidatus Mycosynbacter amalyticus]QHN43050.1 DEAD/DEAH box helicase [Candidatus Mycosynbacter amalyticus]